MLDRELAGSHKIDSRNLAASKATASGTRDNYGWRVGCCCHHQASSRYVSNELDEFPGACGDQSIILLLYSLVLQSFSPISFFFWGAFDDAGDFWCHAGIQAISSLFRGLLRYHAQSQSEPAVASALLTVDLQDGCVVSKMTKALLTATLQNATSFSAFANYMSAEQAILSIDMLNDIDMPDMAMSFVKAKTQGTEDPNVLQTIIRAQPQTTSPKQAEEWNEVVDMACNRIFVMAATCSDIASFLPPDVFERMITGLRECKWAHEDLPLPTEAHEYSGENMCLHPRAPHQAMNTVNISFKDKQMLWPVYGVKCAILEEASVILITGTGSSSLLSVSHRFPTRGFAVGIPATAQASTTIGNGSSNAGQNSQTFLRVRYQLSRLHEQCKSLVCYFAKAQGRRPASVSLHEAYRYFANCGRTCLADILMKAMRVCFEHVGTKYAAALTCSELESILSHPKLHVPERDETYIVSTAVEWALHRRRSEVAVGDEVRVKQQCTEANWRGADCVITGFSAVKERSVRITKVTGGTEEIEVDCSHVYSAAETGLMRLLAKVRTPYVDIEGMQRKLTPAKYEYARGFQCFKDMVNEVIQVRTGKIPVQAVCAERREPREGYTPFKVCDASSLLRHVMLEKPVFMGGVCMDMDEDCVMKQFQATLSRKSKDARVEWVSTLNSRLQQMCQELPQNGTSEPERPRVTVSVVGQGASMGEEEVTVSPAFRGVKRPQMAGPSQEVEWPSSPMAGPFQELDVHRRYKRVRPVGGDN